MGSQSNDHPGVLVHPPFLYLGGLAVLIAAHLLKPLPIVSTRVLFIPGILVVIAGIALLGWARRTMVSAGTNINPRKPTTVIVDSGPFRFTRNPFYVAISTIFLGVTLILNEWAGLAILVVMLGVIHFGVVLREERYLEVKFGQLYRDYRARVRRWI
ncbi:MAG: isoprenylcysteine carboxylmethyltransferase family protein [Candidatus Eisenbacteria bacterium]|nr:isoprenylcysteine carboxylmethyltransferase family protein [Candidatus Eisenbacteria bacterium]